MSAFDLWWSAPAAEQFPYAATLSAYRENGKHFVPATVTGRLDHMRHDWARVTGPETARRQLGAFLDTALDKHDGRYAYGTYCALDLLAPSEPDTAGTDPTALLAQRDLELLGLMGDLIAFELDALHGRRAILPVMRPTSDLSRRRLRVAAAVLRPSLRRAGIDAKAADAETEAGRVLRHFHDRVPHEMKHRLDISLLPVHVVHDEYLFLRVLQSFELTFSRIASLLQAAVDALPDRPTDAAEQLKLANLLLREAARLFPLIASMQPAAFQTFRRYTEGASAIQSTSYKTVEALCRPPDPERLASVGFRSVPPVQAMVRAGLPTLDEALAAAKGAAQPEDLAKLESEMSAFARQMLRWRRAHLELARRFLGDGGGTGYTEGVPYLSETRSAPLFHTVPAEPG